MKESVDRTATVAIEKLTQEGLYRSGLQHGLATCENRFEAEAHTDSSKAGTDVPLRLRGGAETLQIIVKPRLQKDLWSLYWKESMETRTEILEDVKLALPPTATVAEAQKQVEKRLGWEPTAKLERLEGFTDPWDSAVFHGRALQLDKSLAEQGIASGAEVITVRRKLVPEGWKIIKEGEEEEDDSSDEDW